MDKIVILPINQKSITQNDKVKACFCKCINNKTWNTGMSALIHKGLLSGSRAALQHRFADKYNTQWVAAFLFKKGVSLLPLASNMLHQPNHADVNKLSGGQTDPAVGGHAVGALETGGEGELINCRLKVYNNSTNFHIHSYLCLIHAYLRLAQKQ